MGENHPKTWIDHQDDPGWSLMVIEQPSAFHLENDDTIFHRTHRSDWYCTTNFSIKRVDWTPSFQSNAAHRDAEFSKTVIRHSQLLRDSWSHRSCSPFRDKNVGERLQAFREGGRGKLAGISGEGKDERTSRILMPLRDSHRRSTAAFATAASATAAALLRSAEPPPQGLPRFLHVLHLWDHRRPFNQDLCIADRRPSRPLPITLRMPAARRATRAPVAPAPTKSEATKKALTGISAGLPLPLWPRRYHAIPAASCAELATANHQGPPSASAMLLSLRLCAS